MWNEPHNITDIHVGNILSLEFKPINSLMTDDLAIYLRKQGIGETNATTLDCNGHYDTSKVYKAIKTGHKHIRQYWWR